MIDIFYEFLFQMVGEIIFGLVDLYRRVVAYIVGALLMTGGVWLVWNSRESLFEFPRQVVAGIFLVSLGLAIATVAGIAGKAIK